MKKSVIISLVTISLIIIMFSFINNLFARKPVAPRDMPERIYGFKVKALDGGEIDFSKFKGKKIMIVNTASKCGNTPQYEALERIYEKYKDKLVIVGFPANNFLSQEPGTNEEIAAFCKKNYGVTFPMAAKISVKGKDMAPIYIWLTDEKYNGVKSSKVKWNFQKYLLDETGKLMDVFDPGMKPDNDEIIAAIEK